jgi:hypothetical protein
MGHQHSPVRREDSTGQVSEYWSAGLPQGIPTSAQPALVDSWLADIQRRGAKIYSVARTRALLYLSLQGKARFQYSVQIDLDSQHIVIEVDRPEWKWAKRERYRLSPGNLRLLAKRICPLPEGHATVTVDLLTRLLQLCGAYRHLLPGSDRDRHGEFSPEAMSKLESDLRRYLIPDGRQKADPVSCPEETG